MSFTKIIQFSILTLLFVSCSDEIKFNKTDWQKNEDGFYIHRDKMLNDLLSNYDLKNLSENEVINLLGNPENYSDSEARVIYYNIVTDYGWNIDPVYVKNLKIKFNSSKKVENFKIEEHKK